MKEAFSSSIKRLLAHILSRLVSGSKLTVRSNDCDGKVTIATTFPYVVKQLSMDGDKEIVCSIQKEES